MKVFFFLIAAALTLGTASRAAGDEAKTGSLELTFTTRSPLSEMKKIAQRLKVEAAGPDYDLSKQPFLVFVPKAYVPAKPMGLIVLLNYKASESLPTPVLPQFEEANCAFAVSKNRPDEIWQRAGMALDAVANLQKLYKIDPKRIYIFGGAEPLLPSGKPAYTAERLGLNYPEVFTGTFSIFFGSFKTMPAGNNQFYPPNLPPVAPAGLARDKDRAFVLATTEAPSVYDKLVLKSFAATGLKHTETRIVTLDQYHYPMYTTDWIPGVLKFMDSATASLKLPTPAATPSAIPN